MYLVSYCVFNGHFYIIQRPDWIHLLIITIFNSIFLQLHHFFFVLRPFLAHFLFFPKPTKSSLVLFFLERLLFLPPPFITFRERLTTVLVFLLLFFSIYFVLLAIATPRVSPSNPTAFIMSEILYVGHT